MFRAGIYCRVSVEEIEKENEYSSSIYSQIKMAEEYAKGEPDVIIAGTYVDDGVSGSDFDRMGFRRMLADMESGKINMVIIKDASRLGREHIDTNYYLGKYFPEKGIRVLSLLDHYDSHVDLYDEMMDIRTLMNDMYLRDTSKKIKAVIRAKRSLGEYTSKEVPYGYRKSKTIHNHLEMDSYAAETVKRIYRLYLGGHGGSVISRILNEDNILSPSRYKKEVLKTDYPYPTGRGLWTKSSVMNILKNPVYTGAVVLKKTEKLSYKLKNTKVIPLSERELCEHAHEAIISKEQFEQVQKIMENRKALYFNHAEPVHKYSGLLFCGKCGYRMRKRYLASRKDYDGYMCGSHQEVGQNYCALNHIAFEKLDELVAFAIGQQIKKIKIRLGTMERKGTEKKNIFFTQREALCARIEKNRKYCKKAYEQYLDEALTKAEYLELKAGYDAENSQYHMELEQLEAKPEQIKETEIILTRELLLELIGRIEVYPDGKIDIQFKFCDPEIKG